MEVNPRKSLVLRNPTCYFDRDKDKVRVRVSSPAAYQSRVSKIEGYETRLYWQFKYCQEHDGQTFFYTLTYNDKNIPNHYGVNCFDYEDLRDLLINGFNKTLLRKYGTKFKYFIGAELGDGKGKRGFHNNPHYHILFFLEPDSSDSAFPYQKISPIEFRHLLRLYWQGFDQDDVFVSFKDARYGIVAEGLNCGLVTDFRACMYCAKYVCKDVKLVEKEPDIKKVLTMRYKKDLRYKESTYRGFWDKYKQEHNYRDDAKTFRFLVTRAYKDYEKRYNCDLSKHPIEFYQPLVVALCKKYGLWHRFYEYLDSLIEPLVKKGIDEWRNRFSNKCRISQGVGLYALDYIDDYLHPSIQVPGKKGMKYRPIGLYYYRKLYCNVLKDEKGSSLYYLNEKGIEYKSANLQNRIEKMVSKVSNYFDILLQSPDLFNEMRSSDVNTEVVFSYDGFVRGYNKVLDKFNLYDVLNRYAVYKLVYQDRFFPLEVYRGDDVSVFPRIDVRNDYEYFLLPSQYFLTRNDLLLTDFLESTPENYLPYSQHPYFLPLIGLFSVLDLCSDYFYIKADDKKQREAEERAATKRFHDKRKLIEFYSQFK